MGTAPHNIGTHIIQGRYTLWICQVREQVYYIVGIYLYMLNVTNVESPAQFLTLPHPHAYTERLSFVPMFSLSLLYVL